jgi:hypothetical protein
MRNRAAFGLRISDLETLTLSLPLLVPRVLADHADHAPALDDPALIADLPY